MSSYGCHCHFNTGPPDYTWVYSSYNNWAVQPFKGAGQPLDAWDANCKTLQDDIKCAAAAIPGCNIMTVGYYPGSNPWQANDERCDEYNPYEACPCSNLACKRLNRFIDTYYLYYHTIDDHNYAWFPSNDAFDWNATCADQENQPELICQDSGVSVQPSTSWTTTTTAR